MISSKTFQVELRHFVWTMIPVLITLIFAAGGLLYTINATTAQLKADEVRAEEDKKEFNRALVELQKDSNDKYERLQESISVMQVQLARTATILEQMQKSK